MRTLLRKIILWALDGVLMVKPTVVPKHDPAALDALARSLK